MILQSIITSAKFGFLLFGIVGFTLYWLSKSKDKIVTNSSILLWLGGWGLGFLSILLARHGVLVSEYAGLAHVTGLVLFGYVWFHKHLLLDPKDDGAEAYYLPIGKYTFIALALICTVLTLFRHFEDIHFLLACLVTSGIATILHRRGPSLRAFQLSAIFLVLLFLGLVVADPFIFGYAKEKDVIHALAKSAGFHAMYAIFPFLLIIWGMLRLKLATSIDIPKVFHWTTACVLGCLVYRNPLAAAFITKIPIMKDIVPAGVCGVAYLMPLGLVLSRRSVDSKE